MVRVFNINYINDFECLADRCPDTCCAEWMIEIDDASLEKYGRVEGDYAKVLEDRIDREEKVFLQKENGDCCFLCDNKLCEMYSVLGERALCNTCRLYPRHIEEFSNVREMTLSASCPEAARLLLLQTEPLSIVEDTDPEHLKEYSEVDDAEDFNEELYECLKDIRRKMLAVMQDRSTSYFVRAAKVVAIASDLQDELDGFEIINEAGDLDDDADTELDTISNEADSDLSLSSFAMAVGLFDCLKELEHLKDDRAMELDKAKQILYDNGAESWSENKRKFEAYCKASGLNLEIMCEQLTVYYLYSYFCGAVYDDYVFSKAMGAVAHTILIKELWMADWLAHNRSIDFERMVCILYEYARELENSNQNLIKMDEMMDEIGF